MSRPELEEERRFLLESLDDLERERDSGDIDPGDYESLRDDYTARAAVVIRQMEELERAQDRKRSAAPSAPESPPAPAARESRGWQRWVALGIVGAMVAATFVGVLQLAADRGPGDSLTGDLPTGVAGRLAQAHALEAQGEAVEAIKLYDSVLSEDPANVEALAYRGWLLRLAGLVEQAQESLDLAVSLDPSYPDARFFRAMLLLRDVADPGAAIADFEAFLAFGPPPEVADRVEALLEEARAAAGPAS